MKKQSHSQHEVTFTRKQVKWARDMELLHFRTLREDRNRIQIDRLQREHFGQWSDLFSSLVKCRGRVMICLLGKTVIGYQAFEPFAEKGNPFSEEKQVMRFTFILVREDKQVKARGLGVANKLLKRTEVMAWNRGYDAIYTYATAYDLMLNSGYDPLSGMAMVREAQWVGGIDPDQAPALLFTKVRPVGWWVG